MRKKTVFISDLGNLVKVKYQSLKTVYFSLVICCVLFVFVSEMLSQVRTGGGRIVRPPTKVEAEGETKETVANELRAQARELVDMVIDPVYREERTGRIELWVDNQSLHASDTNVGSPESPFRSIQAAVRSAVREVADGEALIRVFPGVYRETVRVPRYSGNGWIVIKGEDNERSIISGGEMLGFWEERRDAEGNILFAHEDIFPEQQETGVFYVGGVRQIQVTGERLMPGEFYVKDGEILWRPGENLDWKHASINAPVRPYSDGGLDRALIVIDGGRVRVESFTLKHSAKAEAVVVVNGVQDAVFSGLRLSNNEAPGFAIAGDGEVRSVFVENVLIFGEQAPFFSVSDVDFTLRDSLMDEGKADDSLGVQTDANRPLISVRGSGSTHISGCLIASVRRDAGLELGALKETVLHGNILLNTGGQLRVMLTGRGSFAIARNDFLALNKGEGLTLFEVRPDTNFPAVSWRKNAFENNVALVLVEGPMVFPPEPVQVESAFTKWRFLENCLGQGATVRVLQTNRSAFGVNNLEAEGGLIDELENTKPCGEDRLVSRREFAEEKLRLLRD